MSHGVMRCASSGLEATPDLASELIRMGLDRHSRKQPRLPHWGQGHGNSLGERGRCTPAAASRSRVALRVIRATLHGPCHVMFIVDPTSLAFPSPLHVCRSLIDGTGSRAHVAVASTRHRAAEPRPCKSHFPHQQRRQHPSSHRALATALDTTSNTAHTTTQHSRQSNYASCRQSEASANMPLLTTTLPCA